MLPKKISSYCEPFLGGGAVLFSIQPKKAIVNDINSELMIVYEVVRDDVDNLIKVLKQHQNVRDYFYNIRNLDRNKELYLNMSKTDKAARIIYLNKTCFNGLFRVNSSGEFNTSFGNYKNPNIVNEEVLRSVSEYLNTNNIAFYNEDFSDTLNRVEKETFIYLDPPYDPISTTSNFTEYSKLGFNKDDHFRLKECCDNLNQRGIKFMLSNSATDFIKDLYADYEIIEVNVKRAINCDASKRGNVKELIIKNY